MLPLISMPGPLPSTIAPPNAHAAPRIATARRGLSTCNKVSALGLKRNARRYSIGHDGAVVWRSGAEAVVTLRNRAGEVLTVNTRAARQHRAYRRVHAWAESIRAWGQFERPDNAADRDPRTWYKPRGRAARLIMLTLTYASATAWRAGHIRAFMLALRKRYKGQILGYAWVLEMQKRGAPHYHVLLLLKPGAWIAAPDTAGLWQWGHTNIVQAKSPFYVVKYVGKQHQKEHLPRGARMFAVWVSADIVPMNSARRLAFRLSAIPCWLGSIIEPLAVKLRRWCLRWRRAAGGGWLLVDTGEIVSSGYELESIELLT